MEEETKATKKNKMPGKVKPKEQEGNLVHQMRRRNTYYGAVVSLSILPFPIPCLIFLSLFFDQSPIHLSRQARSPVLYLISRVAMILMLM